MRSICISVKLLFLEREARADFQPENDAEENEFVDVLTHIAAPMCEQATEHVGISSDAETGLGVLVGGQRHVAATDIARIPKEERVDEDVEVSLGDNSGQLVNSGDHRRQDLQRETIDETPTSLFSVRSVLKNCRPTSVITRDRLNSEFPTCS